MTKTVNEKEFFEDLYSKGEDSWEIFTDNLRKEKFFARMKKINSFLSTLPTNDKKMLDIGCGEGIVEEHLIIGKQAVYGIDISKQAIQMAKGKQLLKEYIVGNSISLPFKKEAFDIVFLLETLYYHDANLMLNEVSRITKENGTLILSLGNKNQLSKLFSKEDDKIYSKKKLEWKEKRYSLSELKKMLHNHGFRVKETAGILFPLPFITRRSAFIRQKILFPLGNWFQNHANQVIIIAEKVKN